VGRRKGADFHESNMPREHLLPTARRSSSSRNAFPLIGEGTPFHSPH
jgi:hypothetical protein